MISPIACSNFRLLPLLVLLPFIGNAQAQGILGQKAPDWEVSEWHQLPEGKDDLDIGDFKGKVVYLYFFQSWCPGCHRTGFPRLQQTREKFKDAKDVAFVVIQTTFEGHDINTAAKLAPTAKRYGLDIPFGQSKGSGLPDIMLEYRSRGTPWAVIVDKEGVVRFNDFHLPVENGVKLIETLRGVEKADESVLVPEAKPIRPTK